MISQLSCLALQKVLDGEMRQEPECFSPLEAPEELKPVPFLWSVQQPGLWASIFTALPFPPSEITTPHNKPTVKSHFPILNKATPAKHRHT